MRTLLVIFQYSVSIGLVVCTAVIYTQTLYARSMDVGYTVDNKLVVAGLSSSGAMVSELEKIEGVSSVVLSSDVPSEDHENNTGFRLLDAGAGATRSDELVLNVYSTGFGFFESYGMNILHGRGFQRSHGSDELQPIPEGETRLGSATIVLNESAVRALGIAAPQDAIGRVLRAQVYGLGEYDLEIIGVAQDVYFRSIQFGIRASVYFNYPGEFRSATISFNTADVPGLIDEVERVWKKLLPMQPVSHRFLEDMVKAQYQEQVRQASVFAVFSALAAVIAALGLYGLAAFSAERRTREIGIRKVLGARVRDIVSLLVWQFSLPVLVANVIAWPVAWYLMNAWLQGFHYRIGNDFILMVSVAAGVVSLLVAWLTVSGRAISVARSNPIKALRYE